jgi:hypothetical protein
MTCPKAAMVVTWALGFSGKDHISFPLIPDVYLVLE